MFGDLGKEVVEKVQKISDEGQDSADQRALYQAATYLFGQQMLLGVPLDNQEGEKLIQERLERSWVYARKLWDQGRS